MIARYKTLQLQGEYIARDINNYSNSGNNIKLNSYYIPLTPFLLVNIENIKANPYWHKHY